jgi:hypothetical protein
MKLGSGRRHGATGTLTWNRWRTMWDRCTRQKAHSYPYYGGRGIRVCESWENFENFLTDMGECPEGHSLDRKDNDGHYCKENCRWATTLEQRRNRRNSRYLEANGERLCVAEWAARLGIRKTTIYTRLNAGWSVERALAAPRGSRA